MPILELGLEYQEPKESKAPTSDNLPDAFRRLYYHLYTNSKASRAERILEDLSLLLLVKLAAETSGGSNQVRHYREGNGAANNVLIPLLREYYPKLIDDRQAFNLEDIAIRGALDELASVNLSEAPAHALGEAFQALIGPRLRGDKGQFFTPRSLVRAMVEIVAPAPHESILDPACGTGGFLAEAHAFQKRCGTAPSGTLVGVDKDHDLFRLASAMLRVVTGKRASVMNFNSLSEAIWLEQVGSKKGRLFDVVLTNPPFGARIGVRDAALLRTFDLGRQWVRDHSQTEWRQAQGVAGIQDPQTLFLELCVRRLRPGGRLGIVLPEGMFGNKNTGYVWDWLQNVGTIEALMDCPRTTFQPGTDTKTNVLFFRKYAPSESPVARESVYVAVALNCGHDRRGRTTPTDDFPAIARSFQSREAGNEWWHKGMIIEPDYLVPRYYLKSEPKSDFEKRLIEGAREVSLGELVKEKVLGIRKGHEVGSQAYGTGEIPFVRTSDIANFEISTDPTKSVSEETYREYASQQRLSSGDILMVVDGRYRIGATAMLTERNTRCVVQSHLRIISSLDLETIDPYSLLFALNLPSVRLRLRNLVFIQSTLGTLGKRIFELRVPILAGDGPWTDKLQRFRQVLSVRDEMLAQIRTMSSPEIEL